MKQFQVACENSEIPEKIVDFLESPVMEIYFNQRFNPILKKYKKKNLENARLVTLEKILELENIPESDEKEKEKEKDEKDTLIIHPKKRKFLATIQEKKKKLKKRFLLK